MIKLTAAVGLQLQFTMAPSTSSGTESAQKDRRLTTPHMPNVLTTPTNLSSPILATERSAPSEPDVTPDLFSPTTPEPTIIPETATIFDTPMDRTPTSQSAQLSSDRLPSERKTREDSRDVKVSRPTYLLILLNVKSISGSSFTSCV